MKRVLVFCIEATVLPHLACSAIIGKTLAELGHDVRFASCYGLFERCVSKDSVSMAPGVSLGQAMPHCAHCTDIFQQVANAYRLTALDLVPYLTPEIQEEAERVVAQFQDNPAGAEYAGVKFGKLSAHDFVLSHKVLPTSALDAESRQYFKESLLTAIKSYLMVERVLAEEHYDLIIVYGQYAPNMAVVSLAQQKGIESRVVTNISHMSVDRRWVSITRSESLQACFDLLDAWPEWREMPLAEHSLIEVARDIIVRTQGIGSHVYSSARTGTPGDHREALGLRTDRKLVVAFTSSEDEIYATEMLAQGMNRPPRRQPSELFPDHVSWLRFLLGSLGNREDIQLVIRIHPREDSNHRDNVRSKHLDALTETLDNLPSGVRVIWPRDPVSSYDLMEMADLVLTSWSSVGLECARLGAPVISWGRKHSSPLGDFTAAPGSEEEYLFLVDQMLGAPASLERIRLAFRWYALSRFVSALDFGDVVPAFNFVSLPAFKMSASAAELEAEMLGCRPPLQEYRRHVARMKPTSAEGFFLETRLLLSVLRLLVHFLLTSQTQDRDFSLHVHVGTLDGTEDPAGADTALLVIEDNVCRYTIDGATVIKYSPMAARLARLAAQGLSGNVGLAAPFRPQSPDCR